MSRAAIGVFLVSWLVAYVLSSPVPVTVVHVVIDDLGMHDMGYRNQQTRTPIFDGMVSDGVDIPEFYCYKSCTPSRASLLTGRYPYRLGYHHQQGANRVVPLSFTMLPALLQRLGWRTHAVGKWHVGFARRVYTPTHRGFHTFFGHFGILSNYWEHTSSEVSAFCRPHLNGTVVDFVDAYGGSVKPAEVSVTRRLYASRVLSHRAVHIIKEHAKHHRSNSLYIYLATPNVHTPLQAPCETCRHYQRTASDSRRVADAMLEEVDSGVGLIRQALATADMLSRSVFIVHTDNGGEFSHAVNMPFRGNKYGFWEGGLRGPAFIWSPLLPPSQRGSALSGMAHIADLYATIIVGIAGAPWSSLNDTGPLASDSHNLWPAIMGQSTVSPRSEVVHYPLLDSAKQGKRGNQCRKPEFVCGDQARAGRQCVPKVGCAPSMRRGRFKLLLGWPGVDWLSFLPPLNANASAFGGTGGRRLPHNADQCQAINWAPRNHCDQRGQASKCSLSSPCLFDVVDDPSETYNRAHLFPEIVEELTRRLQSEASASMGDEHTLPLRSDEQALCQVMQRTGYLLPVDWDLDGPATTSPAELTAQLNADGSYRVFNSKQCGGSYKLQALLAPFAAHSLAWNEEGRTSPWKSVLANYPQGSSEVEVPQATKDKFFYSGVYHVKNHLDQSKVKGRILDFGCGLGRLGQAFAQVSEVTHVDCVDQSTYHLKLARMEWDARSKDDPTLQQKLHFVVSTPDLLAAVQGRRYDFVHSKLVLQHMLPQLQQVYLEQLCDALTVGGVAYLQIPINIKHTTRSPSFWADKNCNISASIARSGQQMYFTSEAHLLPMVQARGCRATLKHEPIHNGQGIQVVSAVLHMQKH